MEKDRGEKTKLEILSGVVRDAFVKSGLVWVNGGWGFDGDEYRYELSIQDDKIPAGMLARVGVSVRPIGSSLDDSFEIRIWGSVYELSKHENGVSVPFHTEVWQPNLSEFQEASSRFAQALKQAVVSLPRMVGIVSQLESEREKLRRQLKEMGLLQE